MNKLKFTDPLNFFTRQLSSTSVCCNKKWRLQYVEWFWPILFCIHWNLCFAKYFQEWISKALVGSWNFNRWAWFHLLQWEDNTLYKWTTSEIIGAKTIRGNSIYAHFLCNSIENEDINPNFLQEKILFLLKTVKYAKESYQERIANQVREKQVILEKKLKPKGNLLKRKGSVK